MLPFLTQFGEPQFKLFDPPFEWQIDNIPEGEYNFGVIVRDGPNQGLSMSVDVHVGIMPADSSGSGATDEGSTGPIDPTTGGMEASAGSEESTGPGEDTTVDKGCAGCSTTDRGGGLIALFGLGLGIAARRRRRG